MSGGQSLRGGGGDSGDCDSECRKEARATTTGARAKGSRGSWEGEEEVKRGGEHWWWEVRPVGRERGREPAHAVKEQGMDELRQ